ncbi:NADPH-dependent FMN reductase [Erysipelothrix urinaevulpis]|uniref:NADPH-dependent FMN reductase n=1 Tax=Erysipelothrix urinaevulpis TaxID=2683717 RepID=UPI00135C759A|nr:NAD(P)H-dependent oxidoreductase [Erysipelothrix urinaevulpis]
MIKTVFLVGSLREKSYNMMIAKHIQKRYADRLEIEILDIDLPNYNQDLDMDGKRPEKVENFNAKVNEANAVFMITPEYNHGVSGVLKNAIDWVSRTPGLNNKPGLVASSSMGATAGARGYNNLIQVLDTMPMYLLPGNDIMIGSVHEKFDQDGNLIDEGTVQFIDLVVDKFIEFYNKVK